MSYLYPHCNSSTFEDCIWLVSRWKLSIWWCAICGEKYDWKQPSRLLQSYKQVIVLNLPRVFKAHAVRQDLCANLINALKLLVNQQEDGDGLSQTIVKNLGRESRKGLTNGLL